MLRCIRIFYIELPSLNLIFYFFGVLMNAYLRAAYSCTHSIIHPFWPYITYKLPFSVFFYIVFLYSIVLLFYFRVLPLMYLSYQSRSQSSSRSTRVHIWTQKQKIDCTIHVQITYLILLFRILFLPWYTHTWLCVMYIQICMYVCMCVCSM